MAFKSNVGDRTLMIFLNQSAPKVTVKTFQTEVDQACFWVPLAESVIGCLLTYFYISTVSITQYFRETTSSRYKIYRHKEEHWMKIASVIITD